MFSYLRNGIVFAAIVFALGANPALNAQEQSAKVIETGTFHGKVHNTSGRATVYREADGKLVLRLTNFKT